MEREPTLVRLPHPHLPRGARLVRLRLLDRPGSLARIAGTLAAHDVDILRIEALGRDGTYAIDDLLVAGDGLDAALAELAPVADVVALRADVDLPDPALAMAEACAEVAHGSSARDVKRRLLGAALRLVFSDAGFVCTASGAAWLVPVASTVRSLPVVDPPSLLHSALSAERPLTADARAPWAPPRFRELLPDGTLAAVPAPAAGGLVLGLVRTGETAFVQPELERLEALLRVSAGVLGVHDAPRRSAGRVRAGA